MHRSPPLEAARQSAASRPPRARACRAVLARLLATLAGALVLACLSAAAADAATLTITSPLPGSVALTPTFAGTGAVGEGPVTVSVYHGSSASGVPVETQATVGEGGLWTAEDPALEAGEYTAVAAQQPPEGEPVPSGPVTFKVASLPHVGLDPEAQVVLAGEDATFTSTATGFPAPAVHWEVSKDGGETWTPDTTDSGAETGKLVVGHAALGQSGWEYRAVFDNGTVAARSQAALLTVHAAPIVTKHPQSVGVKAGQTAHFKAQASGSPAPQAQWQVSSDFGEHWTNDKADSAKTTETGTGSASELTVTAALAENGYQYRAVFSNGVGEAAETRTATLTVSEATAAPQVTESPEDTQVTVGEAAIFTADAGGVPTPGVQWEVSTDGGKTWAADTDPGNRSTTLVIASAKLAQSGNRYRAVFSNGIGSPVPSSAARLTVSEATAPPNVTADPAPLAVTAGETAVFTAAAGGMPAPAVQWEVSTDGGKTWAADHDPGSQSTTLMVTSAKAAQSGSLYRAVFSNGVGAPVASAAAMLTVSEPPAPAPAPAPAPPVASFSWFPTSPHAGEPLSLVSTSTSSGATLTRLAWSLAGSAPFAEGGPQVSTSFATPGPHAVTLQVTDSRGRTASVTETITVSAQQLIQPFPVVRIAGSDTPNGARLSIVTVLAPSGSTVSVTCTGRGCRSRRVVRAVPAGGGVTLLTFGRFQTRLGAGARLVIRISRSDQIGKYTSFAIRRGRLPVRVDSCLSPTGEAPMPCPGQ